MVDDRGCGSRGVRDGPGFRPAGSPRARFAPETTASVSQLASARPHDEPFHAPITDGSVLNLKMIFELYLERALGQNQLDTINKKIRKLRDHIRRCQNSEFSSAVDFNNANVKAADIEKTKLSQRIAVIDDKIKQASSLLEAALQSQPADFKCRDNPIPSPETSSNIDLRIEERFAHLRDDIEVRVRNSLQSQVKEVRVSDMTTIRSHIIQEFEELRSSLEAEIRKRLTEEFEKLQSKIQSESKIATLEEALLQERNISASLQAKMQSIETRLADMEKKIEDQACVSQPQLPDKQEAFVEPEFNVAKCEDSQMAATTSQKQDDNLGIEFNAIQPNKLDRITKDSPYLELELKLKNKMTQFLQSRSLAMEEHVQVRLNQLASDFGTWMDKEREMRLSLDEQVKATKQSANAAVQAVEVMAAELAMNQTVSEANRQSDMSAIANQKALLQGLDERIGAAEHSVTAATKVVETMRTDLNTTQANVAVLSEHGSLIQSLDERIGATAQFSTPIAQAINAIRSDLAATQSSVAIHGTCIQRLTGAQDSSENEIRSTRDRLQKSMDALWLRTKNLNDWQQNFSTRGLFDAIVKHLNESFVPEHVFNFKRVLERVQSLESQLGDGSSKKRKLNAQPSAITT